MNIQSYIASPDYPRDLAATQMLWSPTQTTATAGVYVFLLYLSVPVLLSVRSGSGLPARAALDGERERVFLMNLTGCVGNERFGGGIRNLRVQQHACLLGRRHANFKGMRSDYIDFIATVITVAALEARTGLAAPADAQLQGRYWRYMWHATLLLGADIGDEPEARDRCLAFLDAHAAASSEGSQLYASLQARHPRYVEQAIPLLPMRARAVIGDLDRAVIGDLERGTVW